jgi:DNA mismatch repair protein MutL
VAVLPSAVADQIAAGEVVERPASAVKELVENALDAGATAIDIEIDDGGRGAIRVSDDGQGMDRADALLALERHATSKIRTAADLVGVTSFGFRGEALPAIASVSECTVETASADGGGTRVQVRGGTVADVRDAARRRGTTVSVTRLFYNVPARLKFLRSPRSEWRAIADTVITIALARRDAHLTLAHDGKRVMSLPPAASLRARVAAIWGPAYATSLVDVEDVQGEVAVSGLVERPADVGTRTRRVHLAVNGRGIRDAGLVRAAESAYRSTLPAGLRPSVLLDIRVSHDTVDVNVHPAKAEVRFRDRWPVERAVEAAVRRALGTGAAATVWGTEQAPSWPGSAGLRAGRYTGAGGVGDAGIRMWGPPTGATFDAAPGAASVLPDDELLASAANGVLAGEGAAAGPVQLRRTYLMYEQDDGLVLIDQHSAHERVLYERFLATLTNGTGASEAGVPAQRLLFPLTLHLGSAAADAFEAHRTAFEQLGFEAETFGGNTLLVHAVPVPHPRFDAERCLRDTLDALTGDRSPGTHGRHERLAATVACKAAIKAGDALAPAEMRALVAALEQTTLPAHDVHGRATIVRLSWDEVERRFGRR